jgi:hypothetical protein
MRHLHKFLRLSAEQRWLLIKATVLLGSIRVALRLLPFPVVRPHVERVTRCTYPLAVDPMPAEQLAWAIDVAGHLVPGGGHCLSQALALQVFLVRRGYKAKICFGIQKPERSALMAHAWVEHNGVVLIGGSNLQRFTTLVSRADPPR